MSRSARDADLADELAVVLSDYSDRSLGRAIGTDHKTALLRKTDVSTWRLVEAMGLADVEPRVRLAILARLGQRGATQDTVERAAETTIQGAGALIQGLMADLSGDHRISVAEARRRLGDARAMEIAAKNLVQALESTIKRGGR